MKRKRILAGNWKMYKTRGEAKAFVQELAPKIKQADCRIFIAPPFTAVAESAAASEGTAIVIGAQNMHDVPEGAFTGEISAPMLVEAGAQFVILGHSERRQIFLETNAFIQRKVERALNVGLQPILCIGETQAERASGRTEEVLAEQLSQCLAGIYCARSKCDNLSVHSIKTESLIIAYEPVWAIGTGNTATPEMAQAAHRFCRAWLAEHWGKEMAEKIAVLYGGSVKPETIAALCEMPDIDGALVGGAALNVNSFSQMANLLK